MNSIKGFMNGLYKVVGPAVNVLFALFLTIAGNCGFQALKASKNAITAPYIVKLTSSPHGAYQNLHSLWFEWASLALAWENSKHSTHRL